MRNKEKDRLVTLRMAQAAVKQIEIDERRELGDDDVLKVLDKCSSSAVMRPASTRSRSW